MSKFIEPILEALLFFPIAAGVFTIPYMIHCYRKYGSILFTRVLCVYSFILYLLCVYCLAILPFPDASTVVTQKVGYNLIPFSYVPELLTKPVVFSISEPSTWLSALYVSGLYEPILNIIMFFPLGIFLRYYFGFNKRKTLLCAFFLSLFLELTQLTGTYGLAPFRYRLCDVNDLIDNTLGGFLGYLATPLFTFVLPTRKRLNQVSYQRGARVSYVRRTFAFLVDAFLLMALSLTVEILMPDGMLYPDAWESTFPRWDAYYVLSALLLTGVLPRLWHGKTLGKALVKVRIVDDRTGDTARLWQYMARAFLLYICFLRIDILLAPFTTTQVQVEGAAMLSLCMTGLVFLCAVWHGLKNEPQMGYEYWTHTREISTVVRPVESANDAEAPVEPTGNP